MDTKTKRSKSLGVGLGLLGREISLLRQATRVHVLIRKDTGLTRETADALVSLFPKQEQSIGPQIPAMRTSRGNALIERREDERTSKKIEEGTRRRLWLSAVPDRAQVLREEKL